MNPEITQAKIELPPLSELAREHLREHLSSKAYNERCDQLRSALDETESLRRKCGEKDALLERMARHLETAREQIDESYANRIALGAELASLRASGEKWVEIKYGCELPPYGIPVWVVWNGLVQDVAYARDIGEWVPACGDSDSAPNGTFSHYQIMPAPPAPPTDKEPQ